MKRFNSVVMRVILCVTIFSFVLGSFAGYAEIVPFESDGEPGLWPGFDPDSVPPIPTPQADPEKGGALSQPVKLTPEKTIKNPTFDKDERQAPPLTHPSQPAGALSGKYVYVNPGHGWYKSGSTWKTQRGNNNNIVEDHGNADQVSFFMVQYLRNAGATVIPIRDVGPETEMHIIDNDDTQFTMSGSWNNSTGTPYWGDSGDAAHYVFADTAESESSVARWTPNFSKAGYYPVFVWYLDSVNRCSESHYRIVHKGGISEYVLDQSKVGKGWIWLGNYYFDAGSSGYLELTNESPDIGSVVIADAARFGSGVHSGSGYPLYEVDAHEYAQFSKADSSVTSVSDVWCRPRMAAYMNNAGIDESCYISFHTNGLDGSVQGAMTLTNRNSYEGGAMPRADQFSKDIIEQVDEDLFYFWGLPTRNDQVYTSSYGELTNNNINGEMTGTIVEVAFHDNVEDAKLLKTPGFRRDAARAVLQGIVDYFADHGNPVSTYLPDAPENFMALISGPGQATLSWEAPPSSSRGADPATGYIIYKSDDGVCWDNGIDVGNVTSYSYSGLTEGEDYYFRVSAYNDGGQSFPSECMGLRMTPGGAPPEILVVSGFRRYDREIVPEKYDSVNGWSSRMWPWLTNNFHYVARHGRAISGAGYYFESASNERLISTEILPGDYDALDWILGRESTNEETFDSSEQPIVSNYLQSGGSMFISAERLLWDLEISTVASSADTSFLHNVFHVSEGNDDGSNTDKADPVAGSIFNGISQISFEKDFDNGYYQTEYPDAFVLLDSSESILSYADTGLSAGMKYEGSSEKLVILGFPFEMIHGENARTNVMAASLDFLTGPIETPTPTATPTPTGTPYLDFSATPLSAWAPQNVCFTQDTNIDPADMLKSEWDFDNDGSFDATANDVCYEYEVPGTYSVKHRIETASDNYTETKTNYIDLKYRYPLDNPDTEGWEPWSMSANTYVEDPLGSFYVAPASSGSSSITIENPGDTNMFGYWQMKTADPIEDWDQGYIYRAKFLVSTSQEDQNAVPQMRLRWNDINSLSSNMFTVSRGNRAPETVEKYYDLWYYKTSREAALGTESLLYFDLVDFSEQETGDLLCSEIRVTRHAPVLDASIVAKYNTDAQFEAWSAFSAPGVLDVVTSGSETGSLWLESPGPAGEKPLYFGGWGTTITPGGPEFEADKFYWTKFTLRSDSEEEMDNLPKIRMRISNGLYDWSASRILVPSSGNGDHTPPPEGAEFSLYMKSPPNIAGEPSGSAARAIILNVDIVDGTAEQSGRVWIDKVIVGETVIP